MLRRVRVDPAGAALAAAASSSSSTETVVSRTFGASGASAGVFTALLFGVSLLEPNTWCLANFFCSSAANCLSSSPLESQSLLLLAASAAPPTRLPTPVPKESSRGAASARMAAVGGGMRSSASAAEAGEVVFEETRAAGAVPLTARPFFG
jgi:hypothetical protein